MPPKVERQVARPAAKPASNGASVLNRTTPIKKSNLGRVKMATYGVPKSGKTRLGATFPKPELIIGPEDGTASIVGMHGIDFVHIENTDECRVLVNAVRSGWRSCWSKTATGWREIKDSNGNPVHEGEAYASIMLDNATKLRDMRVVELFASRGMEVPDRKPFLFAGQVWKDVWTQCSKDMKDLLRPLLDLPRVMPMNVIIIAQEQNFTSEEGTSAVGSELLRPSVGSALGKGLCDWLHAECDYICQTLIRAEMKHQEMLVDGTDIGTDAPTGRKQYCLRVGPHEIYQTGFRLPNGGTIKEEFIIDPSYEKIAALIGGKST